MKLSTVLFLSGNILSCTKEHKQTDIEETDIHLEWYLVIKRINNEEREKRTLVALSLTSG